MAKDKEAKFALPKRIGGFKIPKKVRKSSGPMLEFLNTPHGREMVAGALVAIATSLVGREWVRNAAEGFGEQAARSGPAGSGAVRDIAEVAADAIAETANHAPPPSSSSSPPSSMAGKKAMAPRGSRKVALATTSLTPPADTGNVDQKRH